jgi:hypothetical protein
MQGEQDEGIRTKEKDITMRATQWETIIPRGGRAKTSQERI